MKRLHNYNMWYTVTKRLIDIIASILLICTIFLPIIIITSIAILLDTPGPILADTPNRVGKNGKLFKLFKFRSMVVNAHQMLRNDPKMAKLYEEYRHNSYKLVHDPRVTRVGRFIRKHSIDEIPQLFNVLKGDMSLVGPRPLPLDQFNPKDIRQHIRLLMLPGITGLWQIRGRSETSFERMIAWDFFYMRNRNFWLDLKILCKTPKAVLKGRGAY